MQKNRTFYQLKFLKYFVFSFVQILMHHPLCLLIQMTIQASIPYIDIT